MLFVELREFVLRLCSVQLHIINTNIACRLRPNSDRLASIYTYKDVVVVCIQLIEVLHSDEASSNTVKSVTSQNQ